LLGWLKKGLVKAGSLFGFALVGYYDTGNNLTHLSHQANSGDWQQTLTIHPNSNRGTENNNQNNFDANGKT
jgi:O-acetylhomoserine/O-acetylserine sulfhydrylase-like pyridoxal-dependent enzyme